MVGGSNPGDDARDLQVKKDPLPSKEGNVPRGFGGNGSGKSALHTDNSVTPIEDEVIQASENNVLVSGREMQSEKPMRVDAEEVRKAVEVFLVLWLGPLFAFLRFHLPLAVCRIPLF